MNTPYVLIGAQPEPWGTRLSESLAPDLPVRLCSDDTTLMKTALASPPSLVILDLHSIDRQPAINLLRQLRGESQAMPIVLTGPAEDDLRLSAYEAGADDYCPLPISERELRARVKSRIRNLAPSDATLRCGQISLNLGTQEAVIAGQSVPLTTLEFALLGYFLKNPRQILSRTQILNGVWKESVSARTVDAHIALLRRKLPPCDYEIRTVYAAGYTLRPTQGIPASSVETW